jgi:drug/metabolite transporter (DMT)-like permease
MNCPGISLREKTNTALGLCSIIFWSSTVAISRPLTESLGKFTAAACIYLAGGIIACAIAAAKPNGLKSMLALPRRYLIVCGSLFVLYVVLLYAAIGSASDRRTTIVVGLVNYLWPALVFVFSIPILGKRPSWLLIPGVALGIGGIFLAVTSGQLLNAADLLAIWKNDGLALVAALIAAVCWGLYTNCCRRFNPGQAGAVPLFILASGVVLAIVRLGVTEQSTLSESVGWLLAANITFPVLLSYVFWERAARGGNLQIVAGASYLTPVLSTIISSSYLNISLDASVWVGCVLVVAGAVICNLSFVNNRADQSSESAQSAE